MFRGFDRPSAARFAFLMSVPVMLAAGAYEMIDVLQMPDLGAFLPLLAVGFVSAAISGWFAIRWLIAFLGKNSLYGFAILLRPGRFGLPGRLSHRIRNSHESPEF
jgi:undecaprenyl-diphosphatase